MPTVDVHKVAAFLNVTPRRVQQLVKEGMPRGARGQYDPIKCGAWYVRFLQAAIEKKTIPSGDGGYVTLKEERTRLIRAKAELKQIEVAKRRGLLVSLADVEKEMTDLVLTTKARILAIPAQPGALRSETTLDVLESGALFIPFSGSQSVHPRIALRSGKPEVRPGEVHLGRSGDGIRSEVINAKARHRRRRRMAK